MDSEEKICLYTIIRGLCILSVEIINNNNDIFRSYTIQSRFSQILKHEINKLLYWLVDVCTAF